MSMVSPTIMKISVLTNSVKLKWPPSIRDIHSTYVVEGRAPSKSLVWNTHASRILATTVVIKGLQLDAYDYEFRVRTSNVAGLGEPTRSVSTSELREKGECSVTHQAGSVANSSSTFFHRSHLVPFYRIYTKTGGVPNSSNLHIG